MCGGKPVESSCALTRQWVFEKLCRFSFNILLRLGRLSRVYISRLNHKTNTHKCRVLKLRTPLNWKVRGPVRRQPRSVVIPLFSSRGLYPNFRLQTSDVTWIQVIRENLLKSYYKIRNVVFLWIKRLPGQLVMIDYINCKCNTYDFFFGCTCF